MSKKSQLERIENLLNRLDSAVVVRDPGSARAAEAYDGLRKQITQSGKNHRIHTAHLLSLSDSLERGADIELIRDRVEDFLNEIGVQRTFDISIEQAFEIVEGEGSSLECIEPAVVESNENGGLSIVRLGKARRIAGPVVDVPFMADDSNFEKFPDDESSQQSNGLLLWISGGIFIMTLLFGIFLGRSLFDNDDQPSQTSIPVSTTVELTTTTTTP